MWLWLCEKLICVAAVWLWIWRYGPMWLDDLWKWTGFYCVCVLVGLCVVWRGGGGEVAERAGVRCRRRASVWASLPCEVVHTHTHLATQSSAPTLIYHNTRTDALSKNPPGKFTTTKYRMILSLVVISPPSPCTTLFIVAKGTHVAKLVSDMCQGWVIRSVFDN